MSEVVLLGRGGMLGRAIEAALASRGLRFSAFDRASVDVTRPEQIRAAIGPSARLVLNCTAFTDVDGAEQQEQLAHEVNARAVGLLAERARQVDALLVHFSTDYVFSGDADVPYETDSPRSPINAYGRSKLAGEHLLQASEARYLLLRTSWLYAAWGKNFVRTMLGLMRTRPSVRVVDDQIGRPTSVESLAEGTLTLVERGATGTYHLTDAGQCTWFDFAQSIARIAEVDCEVTPCASSEFPRPAPRPRYSVLSLGKTEALLGKLPDWRLPLARTLSALTQIALVLLSSACGASPESAAEGAPLTSGVASSKALVDLDAEEIERLCRFSEQRSRVVECRDGSRAAHASEPLAECVEHWPKRDCAATVVEFEACLTTDPCDSSAVVNTCVVLAACSLGSSAGFICANGLSKVPLEAVCDGAADCPDASDESDCGEL
jgi:dTDP-4-dehydrorhamnose reductase